MRNETLEYPMSGSDSLIDLIGLQHRLDALSPGMSLAIPLATYRKLFGQDDGAHGQAIHFATGHGCDLDWQDGVVAFEQRAPVTRAAAASRN